MNLIKDPWLPVTRKDGTKEKISIWQLVDNYKSNPVIDIEAPRPDFRNAIFQLLIGIVQVAAMPEDENEWFELWDKPYSETEFKKKILHYEECFEIDADGPAFMQDYSLNEFNENDLTNIFIDLPSNQHFNKTVPCEVDIYWAAIALYTLQTFASGGGRGHNTGIRGGGPMTTILYPRSDKSTIWQKIWINIISNEYVPDLTGNSKKKEKSDIFPWMKPTKISSSEGSGLYSQECHPFHMYFAMPRRIRLNFSNKKTTCMISGEQTEKIVNSYKTFHSGNDYSGVWLHPLNAYRINPKKPDEAPISEKSQPGGIAYHYWPKIGLGYSSDTTIPAFVLTIAQTSNYRKKIIKKDQIIVWAAGYDNDKMKARCWYEATMPVYQLEKDEAKELENILTEFINFASESSTNTIYRIKEAWFKSPKDAGGDLSHISTSFWHNTEPDFYRILSSLVADVFNDTILSDCASEWLKIIKRNAINLFDTWALSGQENGLDMKRVIHARNGLEKTLRFCTESKILQNRIKENQEVK